MRKTGAPPVETPLTGGRITQGVVRVGDTVRRPATTSSPFVASLLTHLEHHGYGGAPRYLGTDEVGRDMFSYLSGEVPARFQHWDDSQVSAAGALLRSYHDATGGTALGAGRPVVCHHDPGPNNVVFQEGRPVAFIDFDMAAPGDPLEDLGYMAWTWCVSSKLAAPEAQAAQVRILVDAYGASEDERAAMIDAMLDRQTRNVRWWRDRQAEPGMTTAKQIADVIAWSMREHAYTAANRRVFADALR